MKAHRVPRAVIAAVTLLAMGLAAACVERVKPCEELAKFAEIYAATCPEVEVYSTSCATNLDALLPEIRQDFDWCVDCYYNLYEDPDGDCHEAPLGAACPTLLNDTLDASCTWPIPVL
jgi:hypothetical protein